MTARPVRFPSGYATAFALGTTDPSGNLALIDAAHPLPVTFEGSPVGGDGGSSPSPADPLSGAISESTAVGPFNATPNLPIILALSGEWSGSVRLLRSVDSGATRLPLTVGGAAWGEFAANVCEPVWSESEQGVSFYLDVVLDAGTLTYRLSQ